MPTIKKIAERTGFSPSTVSIVLSGNGDKRKISPQTQAIILEAAQQIGYKPNISARRLRNHDYLNRPVVALFWADDYWARMVMRFFYGMQLELADGRSNCEIMIYPYSADKLSEVATPEALSMFNAVIVSNASAKDLEFLEGANFNIPVVLYNRGSEKFCTVTVDNKKIGETPANIFAARGHKKAAFLTSEYSFPGLKERENSFINMCQKLGMETEIVAPSMFSMAGGYEGGMQICKMENRPDCVFCVSDRMAIGALRSFSEAGIRVPEDIEIIAVGNGDVETAEYASVPLSVIELPMEEMARLCFRQVKELLDGHRSFNYSIELPINYVERKTCGNL